MRTIKTIKGWIGVLWFVPTLAVAALTWHQIRQDRLNAALLVAVKHDDCAAVVRLLSGGADANACEPAHDSVSPWHRILAGLNGRPLRQAPTRSALLVAIEGSYYPEFPVSLKPADLRLIATLLRAGANPDATDEAGRPALLAASLNAERRVVLLLLRHGARADIRLKNGDTLLMTIAGAAVADPSILRAIADHSDIEARNDRGQTALITADLSGNREAVRLLSSGRIGRGGGGRKVPIVAFRGYAGR